jgi:RimJ/RimL family protein N-acetyltransferase
VSERWRYNVVDTQDLRAAVREHWGKGIATRGLSEFLMLEPIRPLHAWIAIHNVGSIRVLEKCGFRTVAQENEQHADGVAEVLMTLGPK